MLASLLPGLRDLRAPLAAGYLWLAAGWLYFAPQLPASVNDADGVLKDIYRVADASNPVAIAAGLTFIAYLLGILSTGLLTPVVPVIWTLLILPIVLSGIAVDSIERRIKKRRQGIHLTEFADDDLWASLTRRRWTTRADRKIDLLAERASTAILIDPKGSPCSNVSSLARTRAVPSRSPRQACRAGTPNHRNTFLEKLEERSIRRLIRRMDGFGIYSYQNLMENASEDEEGKLVKLRKMLAEDLQEGSKAAAVALFASEVDVYEHLREIDEELELVPERIVGDKPATYERWDRLMAEAEFRQAIVPPLFAIVAALMARGVLGWPLWLLAAIIPFVIYYQGVRKENAAEAQLIQTVEANVVQLTTLERLSTADLHWRY